MKYKIGMVFVVAAFLINGCSAGNSSDSSQDTNILTQKSASQSNNEALIQAEDIKSFNDQANSCYNTTDSLTISSLDKAVTAKLIACPTALMSEHLGQYVFIQREYIGSISLSFNQDIAKDFKLSQIYNDLNSHSVVGKIEQIDTKECEKLIASGNTKGQACKVNFVYLGLGSSYGVTQNNNIHLVFKSDSDPNTLLDFDINVHNTLSTNQSYPVINSVDNINDFEIDLLPLSDQVNFLAYGDIYSTVLVNNGDGSLSPSPSINPDSSIASVSVGKNFIQAGLLYFVDPTYITQCGGMTVNPGDACLFEYNQYQQPSSNGLETNYARFVYTYEVNSNLISYTKVQAFGAGDIDPRNYYIESTDYKIVIKKLNFGNESVNYSTPLENLVFTAETNPLFDIPTSLDSSNKVLNYTYGNILGVSVDDLLSKVKFSYDSNCFNGFSPIESASSQFNLCDLKITPPASIGTMPFSFLLYASYDSISGQHIKQLVGSVFINIVNKDSYPVGNYRYYFDNIEYGADGELKASYTNAKGLKDTFSKLDYRRICKNGSTVNFTPYQYTSDNQDQVAAAFLICDELSPNMLKGNYYKTCTDIYYGEGLLSARCLYNVSDQEQKLGGTVYMTECSRNSRVDNIGGKLVCVKNDSLSKLKSLSHNGIRN